jgi:hypothetical protein
MRTDGRTCVNFMHILQRTHNNGILAFAENFEGENIKQPVACDQLVCHSRTILFIGRTFTKYQHVKTAQNTEWSLFQCLYKMKAAGEVQCNNNRGQEVCFFSFQKTRLLNPLKPSPTCFNNQ